MSYFGKNIRKIRRLKKLNQKDFAELFDLSRATIGAYEEERAEPKIDTVINVANYFSINMEGLISRDLTVNEISHFDIFKHGDVAEGSRNINIPIEQIIHLVKTENQGNYMKNIEAKAKDINLPVLKFKRNWAGRIRAFEMKGGGMYYGNEGIRNKDIVICKEITDTRIAKLIPGEIYVVVNAASIVIQRFKVFDKKAIFAPDNPDYDGNEFDKGQIKELWKVFGYYSEKLTNRIYELEKRIEYLEKM